MPAMSFATEYRETKILTATPHQLHLMVIDGAIRFATAAETALQSRNFKLAETHLARANECVATLIAGLDASRQPDLVERLKSVFAFVQRTLAEADRRHDSRLIPEALAVLRLHRQTWLALGEKLAQEAAADQPETESGFSWTS